MITDTQQSDAPVLTTFEPLWRNAMTGTIAAGIALAVTELVSGLLSAPSGLVATVAEYLVEISPEPVTRFGIQVFGTADKAALIVGIVVVSLIAGALIGQAAAHRPWVGAAAFSLFGAFGIFAGVRDPLASTVQVIVVAVIGAGAGILSLSVLQRSGADSTSADASRRRFLATAGTFAALAVVGAGIGRIFIERMRNVAKLRSEVVLPPAADPLAAPSPSGMITVDRVSPLVTPNADFYRIDTAISVPIVDLETWRLQVTGLVDRSLELSFGDLSRLPMVERHITLSCVSNRVGGSLVGNAKWLGVPLREVLERAGVERDGTQLVGRSVDGFTVGFPTEAAFDGRDALIAIGMNGEPLPFEHGFPARLVVAGLYGYVSATKWLSEIEITTWDGFDAYWIPRGWAKEAPIKTQSRIDVPGSRPSAGLINVAGVAWAPHRGISRVEVQIDDGPWLEASLSDSLGDNAWRQWLYEWDAVPGEYRIRVRATDGTGETQTEIERPPRPDGATGYHTRFVKVT